MEIEKEWGHCERILGGICTQQLGLFMIWLSDCNSAQKKCRLALVMGFNRKCGVTGEKRVGKKGGKEGATGEWEEGERGGVGCLEHKRSCDGRWMQINPFSALPEEPKTPTQQNKYRSPGGRAQRDKSL